MKTISEHVICFCYDIILWRYGFVCDCGIIVDVHNDCSDWNVPIGTRIHTYNFHLDSSLIVSLFSYLYSILQIGLNMGIRALFRSKELRAVPWL